MLLYQATTKTGQNIVDEAEALLKDSANAIWSEAEMLQALKQAVRKLYPDIFTPKVDTSLSTDGTSFTFTIPATLDLIMGCQIRPDTSSQYESVRYSTEWDGSNNKLNLYDKYASGLTIKLLGGTRLTVPSALGDTLDIPVDAEDLLLTSIKMECMEMILLDKGKLNQFAAREQGVTEVDVINMIDILKRDYTRRKDEVATMLISLMTRI